MNRLKNIPKKHYFIFLFSLILWGLTTFLDSHIFTNEPLNMNSLPVNLTAVFLMHFLSKILVFAFFFGLLEFLFFAVQKKKLLFAFLFLIFIYAIGLYLTYPGYYMSDDPIIFAYATRYYPVYWHNYLTSLYYMTSMSLFQSSCAPVLLNDILCALAYSYLFYQTKQHFSTLLSYFSLFLGILPFTLLGSLMCFRPALYAPFFLFFFSYLFFEKKANANFTWQKMILLSFLTAVLSFWRSEGILLLLFSPILLWITYKKAEKKQRYAKLLFVGFLCFFFLIIKLPQSIGEKAYYGKDYLIISTTRPLSVIVHREQTYEGAAEDLENISAITDFGYLHNDSLSCSAYNRYNSDHNEGKFTQTGASLEAQSAYLKSAFRLILHNLDLFFGERIQLFCVTNGFFNYDTDLVLNLKPVVTTNFHLYEADRAYGFELLEAYKRIPLYSVDGYASFLFKYGGEAYIPILFILLFALCFALYKKNWFFVFLFVSLILREAIIFLSAPASFIQYSYPTMYVTVAMTFLLILESMNQNKTKSEVSI